MNTYYGTSGNDFMSGSPISDDIYGKGGNDTLRGNWSDSLYGGAGDDVYTFSSEFDFGHCIILDYEGNDKIELKSGETINNLTFSTSGNDLIITIDNYNVIRIQDQFINNCRIETLLFRNGTSVNLNNAYSTLGNDTYIKSNDSVVISEAINGGIDTEKSRLSTTLSTNVENLVLLGEDAKEINGSIVYGNPISWGNYLDYYQGDNKQKISGSCSYVATENMLIQMGFLEPRTDYYPLNKKIDTLETAIISILRGTQDFTSLLSEINTLYDVDNLDLNNLLSQTNANMRDLSDYIKNGRCVLALCDAQVLWGIKDSFQGYNHAVLVTGVAYNKDLSNSVDGFYICDSGRGQSSDAARYLPYREFVECCGGGGSAAIILSNDSMRQYIDNINGTGNELDNELIGNSGSNVLYGLGGNDTLNGAGGADKLYGGVGDDTYYINEKDTIIELSGEGNDTVCVLADKEYSLANNLENIVLLGSTAGVKLNGNDLNNSILGAQFNDILYGGLGDDTLDGGTGKNKLIGGLGNDVYVLNNKYDSIIELANQGTDTVKSSLSYALSVTVENLELTGNSNINATGNAFNNNIIGNSGSNILDGSAGADTMSGGGGDDIYYVDNVGDTIIEELVWGHDIVKSSVSFTLANNIESLMLLGRNNINATGNGLDNVIWGNSGNNIIDGGLGSDMMLGGAGNDTYYVNAVLDYIAETGVGIDSVISSISYTLATNVENITLTGIENLNATGNSSVNYMAGNSGNNILTGWGGNDTLDGAAGIDQLIGGVGNDIYYVDNQQDRVIEEFNQGDDLIFSNVSFGLDNNIENLTLISSSDINGYGNSLNNKLTGNSGANTLDGGTGADVMVGGLGDDTYFVENVRDVVSELKNQGTDTVKSYLSYALGTTFENLELLGDNNLNASGNIYNNVIIGNSGNNIIDGKAGFDLMSGGSGSDSYMFNAGYGVDEITDVSGTADQILFGSSVNKLKIALFLNENDDLLIDYGSVVGKDVIKINSWGQDAGNQIEKLKLSNGRFMTNTDINQIIQDMTAFAADNAIQMTSVNDVKSNSELMSIVSTSWHVA